MVAAIASVLLILVLPGPDGAFKMASLDLEEHVKPEDWLYTRYLTVSHLPESERAAALKATIFWINSLSYRKVMVQPPIVGDGTLLRLDLRDLEWDRHSRAQRLDLNEKTGARFAFPDAQQKALFLDIWEKLADRDPYFQVTRKVVVRQGFRDAYGRFVPAQYRIVRGWLDPKIEAIIRLKRTYSRLFVLRADFFLAQTSFDRHPVQSKIDGLYSDFLILPETLEDLFKVVGVDRNFIGPRRLTLGAALFRSGVAANNRALELLPAQGGFLWRTYDTKTNVANQNILNGLVGVDGFATVRFDGGELIGNLPNGLHFYYVVNAAGAQLGDVPVDVAHRRGHPQHSIIHNAWTCISCHGEGINPFQDTISELAGNRDVGLAAISRCTPKGDAKRRAEDYYGLDPSRRSNLRQRIQDHSQDYRAAVGACNGLSGSANSAGFVAEVERYYYGRVDLPTAAREMGLTEDEARVVLKRSGDETALALVAGQAVARDAWESAFAPVMTSQTYPWEE